MAKNNDPAFLFYPADFLVSTMDMTDEEVGIYIRLLCRQHQNGNLKPKVMNGKPPEVLAKFRKDNQGNYYNERLKTEMNKRKKYAESRRRNGSKGGRPKNHMDNHTDNHMQTICEPYENHTENENENKNKDRNIINTSMFNNLRNKEWA